MEFRFELPGAGWADCTIAAGGQRATVSASYLSHALDDLSGAVAQVLGGKPRAEASFTEEPGEYRWVLERAESDQVRIRILEFDSMPRGQPEIEGREIFHAVVRLRTFGGAVLSELQRIRRELGVDGYRERWQLAEFPARRLEQLAGLLR